MRGIAEGMDGKLTIRGRSLSVEDIEFIRGMIGKYRVEGRTRISRELCQAWGWVQANGNAKDMACRELLLRLERLGEVRLPPQRKIGGGGRLKPVEKREPQLFAARQLEASLSEVGRIEVRMVRGTGEDRLFRELVEQHHYLGYRQIVGEHLKYVAFCRKGPLACMGWGGAAWKLRCRDEHIGWSAEARKQKLQWLANNTRFLILPWVRVPHLASFLLGQQARVIAGDWEKVYGHPVVLLETFVDQSRFKGTCYRAANWIRVGETAGRGKYDRYNECREPVRDVYVYPLRRDFRRFLTEKVDE